MNRKDRFPQFIKHIEPDRLYPVTHFSKVAYDNGELAYSDVTAAKKEGRLKFIINNTSHLILGSDVISLLNRAYGDMKTDEKLVADFIQKLSPSELFTRIHSNVKLERKVRKLKSTNKEQRKTIKRLSDENKQLRALYSKRDAIETERLAELKTHIDECLFNSAPIKVANPEFINACGVYFLLNEGAVVYVGQSINIPSRIGQHKSDGKIFDEVRFILCKKEELTPKENFFLKLLKPPLNGNKTIVGEHNEIFSITGLL